MKRVAVWVRHRDITAFFWVNQAWRNSFTDRMMPLVTHLGGAVWCVFLSLSLLFSSNRHWHELGVTLAESLLISHLVVFLCKKILPRRRPYLVLENVFTGRTLMKDASFPSGHATAAFCTASVFSDALPNLFLIFYGLATLVAFSRVFLGQHYPSDILIGACLGISTTWMLL